MVLADSRNALSDQRARAHTHTSLILYTVLCVCMFVRCIVHSFVVVVEVWTPQKKRNMTHG